MILPMTGTWILLEFSGMCKTINGRQSSQNIVISGMCWNALGAAEKEDCSVVVQKRGNARGAKGAGHRHLARVNWQREEPDDQWKAAAFARWHEPDESRGSSPVL
jgi:hypothetical protein